MKSWQTNSIVNGQGTIGLRGGRCSTCVRGNQCSIGLGKIGVGRGCGPLGGRFNLSVGHGLNFGLGYGQNLSHKVICSSSIVCVSDCGYGNGTIANGGNVVNCGNSYLGYDKNLFLINGIFRV